MQTGLAGPLSISNSGWLIGFDTPSQMLDPKSVDQQMCFGSSVHLGS